MCPKPLYMDVLSSSVHFQDSKSVFKGNKFIPTPDCFCVKTLNKFFGKPGQDKDYSRVTGLCEELGGSSAMDSAPTLHVQMHL